MIGTRWSEVHPACNEQTSFASRSCLLAAFLTDLLSGRVSSSLSELLEELRSGASAGTVHEVED